MREPELLMLDQVVACMGYMVCVSVSESLCVHMSIYLSTCVCVCVCVYLLGVYVLYEQGITFYG